MRLQQGACLSKQGAIAREWLRLEPRHALSAPFKTMPLRCLCSFVPLALFPLVCQFSLLTSHFLLFFLCLTHPLLFIFFSFVYLFLPPHVFLMFSLFILFYFHFVFLILILFLEKRNIFERK